MNIYLLDRRKMPDCSWDEMIACVVVAPDENTARALASAKPGDEGSRIWLNPEVPCRIIGDAFVETPTGILLGSYSG